MKTKIIGTVLTTVALCLGGCADNGPHGGHTAKWYGQHPSAMKAENKWCEGQSISLQTHSKSCERAKMALINILW